MSKVKIEIKNRWTGSVLFEYEKEDNTLRDTVIEAVKQGANLVGANLEGADLKGAYIYISDEEIDTANVIKNFEEKNNIKIKEWYINRNIIPTKWNCFWNYGLIICDYDKKKEATKLIDDKKYDLKESDFWILMNETKSGKMQYSGLILSHTGCLKINDKLEDKLKFKPSCMSINEQGYKNELVFTYMNDEQGLYEVGEVSDKNCRNEYPYAMALKRCFDRVVLKNSRLAYNGVYSDSEADEENKKAIDENEANDTIDNTKVEALKKAIKSYKISEAVVSLVLAGFNYAKIEDIRIKDYKLICDALSDKK